MSTTDLGDVVAGADPVRAVGVLVANPMSDLLLHGEPLVAHARRALTSAGVRLVSPSLSSARDTWLPVVLHDPRCPLTPAAFITELVRRAVSSGAVQVGFRPVTDTVKTVAGDVVGATVDRDALLVVASPVVLPAAVVSALGRWPGPADIEELVALVVWLRAGFETRLVEAPSVGRRVGDATDVLLLEAFAELDGR